MKTKTRNGHTPGPWQRTDDAVYSDDRWPPGHDETGCCALGCRCTNAAEFVCTTDGVSDADADLISAAPDLLDAAEKTLDLWAKHGLGDSEAESGPVLAALTAAVMKAKGTI